MKLKKRQIENKKKIIMNKKYCDIDSNFNIRFKKGNKIF